MQMLNNQQLEDMMNNNAHFHLINVLAPDEFEKKHIPGSVNLFHEAEDFEMEATERFSKDDVMVVYCAHKDCPASTKAAEKLEQAGFKQVYDFKGGLKEWEQTGHSMVQRLAS